MTRRATRSVLGTALLGAALGVAACGGDDGEATVPSAGRVQEAMDAAVAAGAPGVAAQIRTADGEEFLSAGVASLESEKPIRPTDRLRIASVSKAFEGAVVMSLVEEGKLSLDDTAERWVPGLLPRGDEITVRELLAHTSGLPDYTKSEAFLDDFSAGKDIRPAQIVGYVAGEPLAFEPGSDYEYSDTDNIVLGLIVEAVTDRSYARELSERVLGPLELDATILADEPAMPDPHATGYQYEPGGDGAGEPEDVTTALDPTAAGASGAIVSTPREVARFFQAYLGGEIVGPEQLEEIEQVIPGDSSPPGPGTNSHGLAIFRYELPCGEVWGHTGQFPGYRAFGAASSDGEAAVSVLVNATDISAEADAAVVRAQELAACRALGEPLE